MELRLAFLGSIFLTVAVVAVAYAQVPVDEAERPVIIPGNQGLDQAFAAQPIDPDWAPLAESSLERVLEESRMDFVEKDIECRTSMCRAVFTHPFDSPPSGYQEALAELAEQLHSIVEQDPRIQRVSMRFGLGQLPGQSMKTTIYLGE